MKCAEVEILLCDYVDGTLRAEEKSALESHIAGCSACAELAKDVAGATAFFETVAAPEPPAELLTRILHEAPSGKQKQTEKTSWAQRFFGGWVNNLLSPRYAMGMAMTVLSFSMIAKFAHIEPRKLTQADLDPVKIWAGIDDRTHRAWDRAVKYYDNLRLVIEIQSRIKDWTDDSSQAATTNGQATNNKQKADSSGQKSDGGGQKPEAGTKRN